MEITCATKNPSFRLARQHGKILTNKERTHLGISSNPHCKWCPIVKHILKSRYQSPTRIVSRRIGRNVSIKYQSIRKIRWLKYLKIINIYIYIYIYMKLSKLKV